MTPSTSLSDFIGSKNKKPAGKQTLEQAIKQHLAQEKVSFHTPGHKGSLSLFSGSSSLACDLTELAGLDELSSPAGVLADLENRISKEFGASKSFISINGASACLQAAIIAASMQGRTKIILPRNVHRSAISALIHSGLEAVWYEAEWLESWDCWGAVKSETLEEILEAHYRDAAALLVTSVAYTGQVSDIRKISKLCQNYGVLLIADEAHGAHFPMTELACYGALNSGADIVVHSMHKTLSAPTQTGILHMGDRCKHPALEEALKACLNNLQSSSPSYLLMLGIEKALTENTGGALASAIKLAGNLKERLLQFKNIEVKSSRTYFQDPLHILIKHKKLSASELSRCLQEKGVFAEAIIGKALLLLLGSGSSPDHIDLLCQSLQELEIEIEKNSLLNEGFSPRPVFQNQLLSPRAAFFAKSELVETAKAAGRIACDWIAPCPPGYPLIVPGQLLTPETIEFISSFKSKIRVVNAPQLEGDSDGSNTTS